MEELVLKHAVLLQEQSLKKTDLPKEIQSKIQGLSLAVGKYKANPTDDKKERVETTDLIIANDILDWINGGKKTATQAPAKSTPPAPSAEELAVAAAKKKDAEDAAETARLAQEAADKKAADEKLFLEKFKAQGNRIHVSDITNVLGRTPNNEETVLNIPLKKIPLGDGYYRGV